PSSPRPVQLAPALEVASYGARCLPPDARRTSPVRSENTLFSRPARPHPDAAAPGGDQALGPAVRAVFSGAGAAPAPDLRGLGRRGRPHPLLRLQRTAFRRDPPER